MRDEGAKQKRKPGMGDGPPSTIKGGSRMAQVQGKKQKAAEYDMESQRDPKRAEASADPFTMMMQQASRNARYTMPMQPGTTTSQDPTNITPDEHKNMPKTRRA